MIGMEQLDFTLEEKYRNESLAVNKSSALSIGYI